MQRISMYILLLLSLMSCHKDQTQISIYVAPIDSVFVNGVYEAYKPNLPLTSFDYESIPYPDYFLNDPQLNLSNNFNDGFNVTNEGATLGRVLFYDKNLSANNSISCADCHHQSKAFSDSTQFSKGFAGGFTTRNSMAIFNMNYNRRFFWDTRSILIENQVLQPIQHPVEMGMTLQEIEAKLSKIYFYKQLFTDAFGSDEITSEKIAIAMGMFLKSIRSYQSKFDEGLANSFSNYTAQEILGKDLFYNGQFKCNQCHTSYNVGGLDRMNNGLDSYYIDKGVGLITNNENDIGKFKTVSLRNIGLTPPYMHDGRFNTLMEVIDFYSENIQAHPNLDDRLASDGFTGGPPIQFNMTNEEKQAMVAFLLTLTDSVFIKDPKYSNPFPN